MGAIATPDRFAESIFTLPPAYARLWLTPLAWPSVP